MRYLVKQRLRVKTRTPKKVSTDPTRASRARSFELFPDRDDFPRHRVHVLLSPNAKHMRAMMWFLHRIEGSDGCAGLVRGFTKFRAGRHIQTLRARLTVARMFLNIRDWRERPGEIAAHECVHAGIRWAEFRKAALGVMEGEEVLAYAVGRMTAQLNHIGYVSGTFSE